MAGLLKWDSGNKVAGITLDLDDLRAKNTVSTAHHTVRANRAIGADEKRYFHVRRGGHIGDETLADAGAAYNGVLMIGLANSSWPITLGQYPGIDTNSFAWHSDGSRYYNGSGTADIGAWTNTGTLLTVAVDRSASRAYVAQNLLWRNSMDPQAGTGGYAFPVTGDLYPAMSVATLNNRVIIDGLTRIPSLDAAGWSPLGVDARAVTIPTAESDKAFYTATGVALASAQIHYAIFAGAELDVEAAPIAKGSVTLNGSGLLPSLTIATDSTATAGRMVWHVDGTDPADFGGIRPVTLAAA